MIQSKIKECLLTSAIDVQEKRKQITLDLPHAFCQTDQPTVDSDGDRTIMRIEGPMVLILQKIEPGFYDDYIVYEHGKPVL